MSSSPSPAAAPDTDRAPNPDCVSFAIQARAEPGVMPRVVELFAKRGLVPRALHGIVAGACLTIDVQIDGLGRELCDYIALVMRQITGVETVGIQTVSASETPPPG